MCQQLLGGTLGRITEGLSVTFSVLTLVGAQVVYWVLMSNFLFNTGEVMYGKFLFCFFILSTSFCMSLILFNLMHSNACSLRLLQGGGHNRSVSISFLHSQFLSISYPICPSCITMLSHFIYLGYPLTPTPFTLLFSLSHQTIQEGCV